MKKFFMVVTSVAISIFSTFAQSNAEHVASATQVVMNAVINNPNIIVITGKLIDASTSMPVTQAKLNFAKTGEQLINAAVDEKGNFAIAINKLAMGNANNLLIKIAGYEDFKIKKINKTGNQKRMDIRLNPDEANRTSNAKYHLSDDPYNTLVIKF